MFLAVTMNVRACLIILKLKYINMLGCDYSRKSFALPILEISPHTFNRNLTTSRLLTNRVTSCSTLNPNATLFVPLSDIV